jgi:hypothetical protein
MSSSAIERKKMSSIDRFYVAACQLDMPNPTHRNEIAARVDRMLELIEHAVTGYEPFFDVRLVVFPEFAHAAPIYPTVEELLDKLAVPIPNEHTQRYQEKANKLNIYIRTGSFLETDDRWPGHVFNTTCLIGPDGIVSKYRKVHTWIPWEVHTSPHDLAALRAERQRCWGHNMLAHLRMEAYPAYKNQVYPAGHGSNGKITVESNEASTRQGREALKRILRDRP